MPDTLPISIVINNYNYGRFLRQAIDSALAQQYGHTEVIVVDDGSTDDSRDIISKYGRKIVPVLKCNAGQGSAFNAGFAASRGDVVCFLDADDTLAPQALDRAAKWFRQPEIIKVHWPLSVVDEAGNPTGSLFPDQTMPEGNLLDLTIREGPFYDTHRLPPTSGNAWSRRFLERVLPMPSQEFDHGADVYLHTLAPLFGDVARVSEPMGCYRAHGNNHYWKDALTEQKVSEYLGRFESCATALQTYLASAGMDADADSWKRRNFNYLWLTRLRAARRDIADLVPAGGKYILVDECEWGGLGIADRASVPFLECDGQYWGRPTADDSAIDELERLRRTGTGLIVFWWTCFWWLDYYAGFHDYLRSRFPCVACNERLIAFDLSRHLSNGARSSSK